MDRILDLQHTSETGSRPPTRQEDGGDVQARLLQRKISQRLRRRVQRKVGWTGPGAGPNATEATVGATMRRIPLEGLPGLGGGGQAIVTFNSALDPSQPVEVLLHLHGHNQGYKASGKDTRDESIDRIEQQIEGSGRAQMIGILPQGTDKSSFGAAGKGFDAQALIDATLARLEAEGSLQPRPTVQNVVLSAHSGGGDPLGQMLESGQAPGNLGEVALFDAVNYTEKGGAVTVGDELPRIERWLTQQLDGDLARLKLLPTCKARQDYLAQGLRFHAYHSAGGGYAKVQDAKDPQGKHAKDPLPATPPNGTSFIPLADWLERWFNTHEAELADPDAWAEFRKNYQVINTGVAQTDQNHDQLVGHGELQKDLAARPPLQPKLGGGAGVPDAPAQVERASDSGFGQAVPAPIRARVEAATGADLSVARVHTGPASQAAAAAVGALAYTTGQDIHFGAGQFQPGTAAGDHLLAHELAHTVQQGSGSAPAAAPERVQRADLLVSQPDDAAEVEADAVADAALDGGQRAVREAPSGGVVHRAPAPAAPRDPKHPENFPTYEEWLTAFTTIDRDNFSATDAGPGGPATTHDVLGEKAADPSGETAASKAGPLQPGESYIDHVSDTWIQAHLPDELRLAVYQLPADCADVAVMLRHVWVFAHGRTETFKGWTIGVGAGKDPDARARSLKKIQNEVYSGNVAGLVASYTDHSGTPAKSFAKLKSMLHPGDVLVWEHHHQDLTRSGGHTQTIESIARAADDPDEVQSIKALQGNQPIDEAQVPSIQADEKKNKKPVVDADTLRNLPGRRIELGTLQGGDLTDGGPNGQWSWGESDGNLTWLVAAGPPSGSARPAHKKKDKHDKDARSIEDWFPTLAGASADRLPVVFEAALLEARAGVEGGLETFTEAQATQLGHSAGQTLARLRKKHAATADLLRADLLAQAGSIGAHPTGPDQAQTLAERFQNIAGGLTAADPVASEDSAASAGSATEASTGASTSFGTGTGANPSTGAGGP